MISQSLQDRQYAANLRKQELQKELDAINQEIFGAYSKELFEKFPTLEYFRWTQYTPYFNDGDECIFRVNNEPRSLKVNGVEIDDVDNVHVRTSTWDNSSRKYIEYTEEQVLALPENQEAFEILESIDMTYHDYDAMIGEISNFLSSQDEYLMKETFGDHAIVTLYRDGTSDSDGYDHD